MTINLPQGIQRDDTEHGVTYYTAEDLRQAVEDDRAQRGVPDGWVPVPVEPTDDMLCAGYGYWLNIKESQKQRATARREWQAMLAAATQPPLARIAALEAENAALKTVMIAAAEEIQGHWDAHCDADGYGPANLMRRLEFGIPSEYGYTAGAFAELKAELAGVRKDAERLDWLDSGRIHSYQFDGFVNMPGMVQSQQWSISGPGDQHNIRFALDSVMKAFKP